MEHTAHAQLGELGRKALEFDLRERASKVQLAKARNGLCKTAPTYTKGTKGRGRCLRSSGAGLCKEGRDDRRCLDLLLDSGLGAEDGRVLPDQQRRRKQVRMHIPATPPARESLRC